MDKRAQIFASATVLECGLGFLGVGLAWWIGIDLRAQLDLSGTAVLRGLVACLPMFVMLMIVLRSPWRPLRELCQQVEEFVRELFAESNWFELAVISASAGVGEELLFRGVLQPWLAEYVPTSLAVVIVSLLFGSAHSLSATYFVLATLIGAYFGWLAMAYGDLVAPILAHGVYDFVALVVVQRRVRKRL
jgi:membrane protease YdiL (CAAX protease family)